MLLLNTVRVSKYIEDLESRAIVDDKKQVLTLLTEALSLSWSSSDALAWALTEQVTLRMLRYRNSITVLNKRKQLFAYNLETQFNLFKSYV
jgi:hypothetical protein